MKKPPLILVSPGIEAKGCEFGDLSISLSVAYVDAVAYAGGVPIVMPSVVSRDLIAECARRADGVMLTGGDDINPALYSNRLPLSVRRTVGQTPDRGRRDLRELLLIDEVFRQRKPLLAICRGHQLLNVAFGGVLWADLASQVKGALNHRRDDKKDKIAHEVHLTEDALLVKITGSRKLGVNSTHHQAEARVGNIFKVTVTHFPGLLRGLYKSDMNREF